jgi:hypothetical protein
MNKIALVTCLGLGLAACGWMPTSPDPPPGPVPATPDISSKPPARPDPPPWYAEPTTRAAVAEPPLGKDLVKPVSAIPPIPTPPPPPPITRPADVIDAMKRIAAQDSGNRARQVQLAALYALNEDYVPAHAILEALPEPSSYHRTDLIERLLRVAVERNLGLPGALPKLEETLRRLAAARGLSIPYAVLCREIRGFGDYTPAPSARLDPGDAAKIYLHVRDFVLKADGTQHTLHLRYRFQLIHERGEDQTPEVWKNAGPEYTEDRKPLAAEARDFYQTFKLGLPYNLPMGKYTIRFTVTDLNAADRSERADVPIEVGEIYRPLAP